VIQLKKTLKKTREQFKEVKEQNETILKNIKHTRIQELEVRNF
jgi:hypothetical protein